MLDQTATLRPDLIREGDSVKDIEGTELNRRVRGASATVCALWGRRLVLGEYRLNHATPKQALALIPNANASYLSTIVSATADEVKAVERGMLRLSVLQNAKRARVRRDVELNFGLSQEDIDVLNRYFAAE